MIQQKKTKVRIVRCTPASVRSFWSKLHERVKERLKAYDQKGVRGSI